MQTHRVGHHTQNFISVNIDAPSTDLSNFGFVQATTTSPTNETANDGVGDRDTRAHAKITTHSARLNVMCENMRSSRRARSKHTSFRLACIFWYVGQGKWVS